jgi:DNA-binding LacI/PurR family transcriptional regulator/signal transduction histidine kinase
VSVAEQSGRRKRPVVGLVVDSLIDDFQEQIWQSCTAAAEALDVNLLCFIGGFMWHRESGKTLFDLIDRQNVDGVVAMSTVLLRGQEESDLIRMYRRIGPVPIVSIGLELPGFPSVVVDNASGIRAVVDHLIEVHGRHKIAFIRGPVNNAEAEVRFAAYRDSLASHGIPYDLARTFPGVFTRESAIKAVRQFIRDQVEVDGLVGANDAMAIAAMREFQLAGYRIPEQVAVAGFDDIPDAVAIFPQLTTVRQPLRDIGWSAMQCVLALVRGEAVPDITALPAPAVIRRSCGCAGVLSQARKKGSASASSAGGGPDLDLASHLEALFPEKTEQLGASAWAGELAAALEDELAGTGPGRLLDHLEALVVESLKRQIAVASWYEVVRALFAAARARYPENARASLTVLSESALQLVGTLAEQARSAQFFAFREEIKLLPNSFEMIHMDEAQLWKRVIEEPPDLGFPSLYLARYVDRDHEQASLFVHYSVDGHVVLDPALETFPAKQLVPGRFAEDHRYAFAVLPIHAQDKQTGFALCGMGPNNGTAYDFLKRQLSSALTVASLMSDVRRYATDLEGQVKERTRELRDAQRQLVESARTAGMAEVAVGVLHNVGNLINSVNVSAERIGDVIVKPRLEGLERANALFAAIQRDQSELLTQVPKLQLMPDYYAKVAATLSEDRAEIQKEVRGLRSSAALIRDTIKALQDYAGNGADMLLREETEILPALENAVSLQEPRILRDHITVRKQFTAVPPVVAPRAKLVHVLVNLVKNAVEAMRGPDEQPRVLTLEARPEREGVLVRISDTGEGIRGEHQEKIFSYGFTTKRDGHGFGLHTCANYMSQMGGTIQVESEGPGRGATFTLYFPAKNQK